MVNTLKKDHAAYTSSYKYYFYNFSMRFKSCIYPPTKNFHFSLLGLILICFYFCKIEIFCVKYLQLFFMHSFWKIVNENHIAALEVF